MGKYINIEYIYLVISDIGKVKFRENSHMNTFRRGGGCKLTQSLKRITEQNLSTTLNILYTRPPDQSIPTSQLKY